MLSVPPACAVYWVKPRSVTTWSSFCRSGVPVSWNSENSPICGKGVPVRWSEMNTAGIV